MFTQYDGPDVMVRVLYMSIFMEYLCGLPFSLVDPPFYQSQQQGFFFFVF